MLIDQAGPGAGLAVDHAAIPGCAPTRDAGGRHRGGCAVHDAHDIGRASGGRHFGRTAAWSFDLARSTAYTRQGDPAFAGQERDGVPVLRTTDIFYDNIDKQRMSVPHADVQMRLFGA